MRWELTIDQIETYIKVGINEHEKLNAQRIIVSARMWANYPAKPEHIDECVDYGMLHSLVVHEWPKRPHVDLMEGLATELIAHMFSSSDKVDKVWVEITKPDIFDEARAVGISTTCSRQEFEAL